MLGRKLLAADATATGPTDFDTNQLVAGELELGFQVEEDEMLVDLEARLTYSGSAVQSAVQWTFFIDGAASPDIPAAGLYLTNTITDGVGDPYTAYVRTTIRLDAGFHTVEVRVSANTGNITYLGATVPCEVVARRHSHPATLGHGVDSKVQLVQ